MSDVGFLPNDPVAISLINEGVEMALLGAILHDNRYYARATAAGLDEGHFASRLHGVIFREMGRLIEASQIADPLTMRTMFADDQDMAQVGGVKYLLDLAMAVPASINTRSYAEQIVDLARRRRIVLAGRRAEREAVRLIDPTPIGKIAAQAEEAIALALAGSGIVRSRPVRFKDGLAEWRADIDRATGQEVGWVPGLPTSIKALDTMIGGLQGGHLIIVGGRPGMGKSALLAQMLWSIATVPHEGDVHTGVLFTAEMPRVQMIARFAANETGVSAKRQREGGLSIAAREDLLLWERQMAAAPLFIDDGARPTMAHIRSSCERLKREERLSLVGIDYMQLMGGLGDDRVRGLSEAAREMKAMAVELEVPVIALSALSRALEGREDKRPILADLRESGGIEAEADVAIFLYRGELYLREPAPVRNRESMEQTAARMAAYETERAVSAGKIELIVAKNRMGPTGTVTCAFDGAAGRIRDLIDLQGGNLFNRAHPVRRDLADNF